MTILVTGGAGFIGSHAMETLLTRGDRVMCVDDFNDYYDPTIKRDNLERARSARDFLLFEGDIRDSGFLNRVFAQARPSVIIHLAARAGVRASLNDPSLYFDVNCRGTLNLLELACAYSVKRFIFGSSSSVYGASKRLPFREDDPCDQPISPYAASKRAGELLCRTYHHLHRLPIVCLRFFTVYGPRQRPDMAIHGFTRRIAEGKPIAIFGDGSSMRDYTYIDDIVAGVLAAIDSRLDFEIMNLGNSSPTPLLKLVSLLEGELGRKAVLTHEDKQPGDPEATCADVTKAKRLLGFEPGTPIERGIKEFVRWFRAHAENQRIRGSGDQKIRGSGEQGIRRSGEQGSR